MLYLKQKKEQLRQENKDPSLNGLRQLPGKNKNPQIAG
jgi:hypothetical protein